MNKINYIHLPLGHKYATTKYKICGGTIVRLLITNRKRSLTDL